MLHLAATRPLRSPGKVQQQQRLLARFSSSTVTANVFDVFDVYALLWMGKRDWCRIVTSPPCRIISDLPTAHSHTYTSFFF